LVGARKEPSQGRQVFKFKLKLSDENVNDKRPIQDAADLEHNRLIPPNVKLEVWKRDKGRCVKCGSTDNLHFDHIIPFSKGGSSLVASNIQILCARHNIAKRDNIE
jgi:5-methylcytosine-specific restriction endonuclease McrA